MSPDRSDRMYIRVWRSERGVDKVRAARARQRAPDWLARASLVSWRRIRTTAKIGDTRRGP